MLRILIAEAELELVPEAIWNHPAVRKHAKIAGRKPGAGLLDQNLHSQALRQVPDGARRGRPDITHHTLLALLESPLNKAGNLEVAIHTRHHELLRIRSDTRLPRGEARFHGVMAKLLIEGGEKDGLLWKEAVCTPADALGRFAKGRVVRLDEGGPRLSAADVAGDVTLVLGGYPEGAWSKAWQDAAPDVASVYEQPLAAWAVAAEVAAWARLAASP